MAGRHKCCNFRVTWRFINLMVYRHQIRIRISTDQWEEYIWKTSDKVLEPDWPGLLVLPFHLRDWLDWDCFGLTKFQESLASHYSIITIEPLGGPTTSPIPSMETLRGLPRALYLQWRPDCLQLPTSAIIGIQHGRRNRKVNFYSNLSPVTCQ